MKNKYLVCLQYHFPAVTKEGKTQLNAKESFSEGVNCIACHSLIEFKGTKKKGDVANNPDLFRTSKACLGCHNQRNNSKKVPLCQTMWGNYNSRQFYHLPNLPYDSN